tara:strand:+ start:803 stop:1522 length:720 start_codon:yes stop_codon:yes gene_type:complete
VIKIACWSGPRNISTALMRSWSSRPDTVVIDEPFYAYYLKETKLKHPLADEIIKSYPTNFNEILENISSKALNHRPIFYQKHMAHHLVNIKNFDFVDRFENCILIRDPKKVIASYTLKNNLLNAKELGYHQQNEIINYLTQKKRKIIVIDAQSLLENPEKILNKWCDKINISFNRKMLKWKKGIYDSDGLWANYWYNSVANTTSFDNKISKNPIIDKKYIKIYDECMFFYDKMLNMSID